MQSGYVDVFVGLEAERPNRVIEDILHDLGGVAAGTGLQVTVRGVEGEPGLDRFTGENDFQFIGVVESHGWCFGAQGNPVDAGR